MAGCAFPSVHSPRFAKWAILATGVICSTFVGTMYSLGYLKTHIGEFLEFNGVESGKSTYYINYI